MWLVRAVDEYHLIGDYPVLGPGSGYPQLGEWLLRSPILIHLSLWG